MYCSFPRHRKEARDRVERCWGLFMGFQFLSVFALEYALLRCSTTLRNKHGNSQCSDGI